MYIWGLGAGFVLVIAALLRLKGLPDQKPDKIVAALAGVGGVLVVGVFGWFFLESSKPFGASPATPADELTLAVEDGLGSSNRDATRISEARLFAGTVSVVWAINDNLSEGLVKDTARLEATEILEAIEQSEVILDSARKGLNVIEVPITFRKRASGVTKKPTSLKYAWGFSKAIVRTWMR